jgi:tripartite-type tricarboxylate transporter receptor subunit TctC
MQQRLKQDGFVTDPMTLEEFARFVDAENERWRPILKQVGLSPG